MLVVVDTNVLLRVIEPGHPQHDVAAASLRSIRARGHELCLLVQISYEFWLVATSSVEFGGLGMTAEEAEAELTQLGPPLFRLFRDEKTLNDQYRDYVNNLAGKKDYDTRLVAEMQRHGLRNLLTFNLADFREHSEINLLDPVRVASGT